jgi:hypothetical protein
MVSDVFKKLNRAEKRLAILTQQLQNLESEKRVLLQRIMRGEPRSLDVKKADQSIRRRSLAVSRTRGHVANLRAQLETELARFRRELTREKERELNQHMERRARYLKRAEELEVEASRYRHLVTGKKDQRLANVKDLLPSEVEPQAEIVPVDEIIGHTKLEISRISRMNSEALLREYVARERRR